ncbi:MAG: RnfABCDGE type electron transport complex subunit D [Angelakisella sp.]
MASKLIVSPSPHVKSGVSTSSIMMNVAAALMPAVVFSALIFGYQAIVLIAVSVAASVLAEYLYRKLNHLPQTVGDWSAVVTGLLIGMNVPASLPPWMAVVGSIVAIIIVKQLFGGIGDNFANPAIVARIFMFISFSSAMSTWPNPNNYVGFTVDAVSGATPLAILTKGGMVAEAPDMINMLLGIRGGSVGETCTIALLAGGIYLIAKKIISPTIPVTILATIVVMSFVTGLNPAYMLVSGGTMLGAFFMATDYVTSPTRESGKVIFGIGIGVITMLIRAYASYPEGMSFAILIMNIIAPHIDNLPKKMPFGGVSK